MLVQRTILEASQQIKRRYSYSAISSALSSINDKPNDSINALRILQKERMIATRLGFPDKAYELDREIELMRQKAKKQRQDEEQSVLEQKLKLLSLSHTRKKQRLEAALQEEINEMELRFDAEEKKLLKRQELEFIRVLEGASRRAIGKVKKCNCVQAYLCRHNKTASYNTRRPNKVVVQYRRNGKRLRQAGRIDEGQAWEEKAKEIDDVEQEAWRKRISDSIIASPWGANEAIVDKMTENHKKEIKILKQTQHVKRQVIIAAHTTRRRNFLNNVQAEIRKVKTHCRKQAQARTRKTIEDDQAEEELLKKITAGNAEVTKEFVEMEDNTQAKNKMSGTYPAASNNKMKENLLDTYPKGVSYDDDDIAGGGNYDEVEALGDLDGLDDYGLGDGLDDGGLDNDNYYDDDDLAIGTGENDFADIDDSYLNSKHMQSPASHAVSENSNGWEARNISRPFSAPTQPVWMNDNTSSDLKAMTSPKSPAPSTPSFRAGRNIPALRFDTNVTDGDSHNDSMQSPSFNSERFPPTPISRDVVGGGIKGRPAPKVRSPPPSHDDDKLENEMVASVSDNGIPQPKSSRENLSQNDDEFYMPAFKPGSTRDEDWVDREKALGYGLENSFGNHHSSDYVSHNSPNLSLGMKSALKAPGSAGNERRVQFGENTVKVFQEDKTKPPPVRELDPEQIEASGEPVWNSDAKVKYQAKVVTEVKSKYQSSDWYVTLARLRLLKDLPNTLQDIMSNDEFYASAEIYMQSIGENEENNINGVHISTVLLLLKGWIQYMQNGLVETLSSGLEEVFGDDPNVISDDLQSVLESRHDDLKYIFRVTADKFVPMYILSMDFYTYYSELSIPPTDKKLRALSTVTVTSALFQTELTSIISGFNYPMVLFNRISNINTSNELMKKLYGPNISKNFPTTFIDQNSSDPKSYSQFMEAWTNGADSMSVCSCKLKDGSVSPALLCHKVIPSGSGKEGVFALVVAFDMSMVNSEPELKRLNYVLKSFP